MISGVLHGLSAISSADGLAFLFTGALLGTILGVIPGLSLVTVLTFVLALINQIDLTATLCLFLGVNAGMYYSASITSIVLNTPAHPEAFAVTFDGYAMARKGEPGRALGISAASTCMGAVIGCAFLVVAFQGMNYLSDVFHPPEYVALVTLAMVLVGSFGTNSALKVLVSMGVGLILASIGPSPITGQLRYTFGLPGLQSGVSLVAVMLGAIAVPQMVMIFGTASTAARQDMTGAALGPVDPVDVSGRLAGQVFRGIREAFGHWIVLIQGSVTGLLCGIVPGIGGFAANFLSYSTARMVSRKSGEFGTGIPEGIVAPEASSIAKEAGTMIPILGLGIPGTVGGALFLAALAVKGIKEGYGFTQAYPTVPYEIAWVILLAGVIGTAAGVLAGPQLAKITRVPGPLIVPFVLALAVVSPLFSDGTYTAVVEVAVLAIVGLVLRRLRYPLAPFVLGVVLGPTFETNLYLTRTIFPGLTAFQKRPLADGIMALAVAVVLVKGLRQRRLRSRDTTRGRPGSNAGLGVSAPSTEALAGGTAAGGLPRENVPFPLLALITTLALLASAIFFITYGLTHYPFVSYLTPVTAGALVAVPTMFMLPRDAQQYFRARRRELQGIEGASPVQGSLRHGGADKTIFVQKPTITLEIAISAEVASMPVETKEADVVRSDCPADKAARAAGREPVRPPDATEPTRKAGTARASAAIVDNSWRRHGQYRRELTALGFVVGLVALSGAIGFEWAIGIFMAVYGLTCTHRHFRGLAGRLLFTALSTVLTSVLIYALFDFTHFTFIPQLRI